MVRIIYLGFLIGLGLIPLMTPQCRPLFFLLTFFFFPEGEEQQNVREKNREYESAQQRLSSEQVGNPKITDNRFVLKNVSNLF